MFHLVGIFFWGGGFDKEQQLKKDSNVSVRTTLYIFRFIFL